MQTFKSKNFVSVWTWVNSQHFLGSALISSMRPPGAADLYRGNFLSGFTGTHFTTAPSLLFTVEQETPIVRPIFNRVAWYYS